MGASLEPVGHLNHPKLLGLAQLQHFVVDLDDFALSGGYSAADEIVDLEGDEVDVGGPLEVPNRGQFGELDGDGEQSVDESVEVGDGVGVEVVDDVDGVLGGDALVPLYFVGLDALEFVEEEFALHEVVVLGEVVEFGLDVAVLLGHQLVQPLLHLVQHHHQELPVLQLQRLDVVLEIVGGGELVLELVAPLRQDPQYLRALYLEVMR